MIQQTVLPFKLDRTDETLTAHGGLALLAEFTHGLGLRALVDHLLPQPRSHRGYAPSVVVETIILLLQAGGRTLEDLRELTREAALLTLLGQEAIPDPDTVGDWLRRMGDPQTGQAGLHGLGQVRDAHPPPRWDSLLHPGCGCHADRGREARRPVEPPMPRLGFLVETPICLLEEFREGNVSPGSGHLTFYRACQAALPAGKHLGAYRADSASYQAALVNALEADGVRFSITADQDAAVKTLLRELPEAAWTEPPPGCGYELAEAVHTMEKTTTAFRMVCTRTLRRQLALPGDPEIPDVYYVIATNWSPEEKATPDVVDWHNQRGQAENLIKDLKHGIGLERVPPGRRVSASRLSPRLGQAHDQYTAVEAPTGGGSYRPPRRAGGAEARGRSRAARPLAWHPSAVLGDDGGDLTLPEREKRGQRMT